MQGDHSSVPVHPPNRYTCWRHKDVARIRSLSVGVTVASLLSFKHRMFLAIAYPPPTPNRRVTSDVSLCSPFGTTEILGTQCSVPGKLRAWLPFSASGIPDFLCPQTGSQSHDCLSSWPQFLPCSPGGWKVGPIPHIHGLNLASPFILFYFFLFLKF